MQTTNSKQQTALKVTIAICRQSCFHVFIYTYIYYINIHTYKHTHRYTYIYKTARMQKKCSNALVMRHLWQSWQMSQWKKKYKMIMKHNIRCNNNNSHYKKGCNNVVTCCWLQNALSFEILFHALDACSQQRLWPNNNNNNASKRFTQRSNTQSYFEDAVVWCVTITT